MPQYIQMVSKAGLVNVEKKDVKKKLSEGWTLYQPKQDKSEAKSETPTAILPTVEEDTEDEEELDQYDHDSDVAELIANEDND